MPKKRTFEFPYLKPRAITDALRKQVREELPEIAQIADAALQRKVTEAWAFALAHSSFKSIRQIPPAGNPDTNEAKRGDQHDAPHVSPFARSASGGGRAPAARGASPGGRAAIVPAGADAASAARCR